jgi:hypothetical protein
MKETSKMPQTAEERHVEKEGEVLVRQWCGRGD